MEHIVTYDDEDLDNIREFLSRGGDPEEAEEGHLSVLELTAFREGEVSSEEAQRMEDHLSSCPDCSDLLREIEELFQPPAVVAAGTTANVRAVTDARRFGLPRPMAWRRWAPALAAVLTLLVVGFYFVARPDRLVTTLDAVGALREGERFEVVPLSHDLVLLNPSGTSFAIYRAEITNVSTRRMVHVSGLREDRPLEVRVRVPRRKLEMGRHEIQLLGIRGDQEYLVGTYLVDFQGL